MFQNGHFTPTYLTLFHDETFISDPWAGPGGVPPVPGHTPIFRKKMFSKCIKLNVILFSSDYIA
jgi:hypothetical protein